MPATKSVSAKGAATKTGASKKAAIEAVVADAKVATNAQKKRAEGLLALIARRAARMTEDFYEIGKALKELFEKKLYLALSYPSFEAMLDAQGVIGATQARKLIQVVSRVPLETALELGLERSFALTKYTEATPELDTPALLLAGGGTIGGKAVKDVSRREIDEATRKLRKKAAAKKGATDPAEREAKGVAKQGAAWLKGRGAKKVSVEARRTKDGHVVTITLSVAEATRLFAS